MTLRMLTAIALAAGGFALAVAACGGDESASPPPTTPHESHTTTTTATTTAATTRPEPRVRRFTIAVEQGRPEGGIKTFTVARGQRVAIVVRSDVGESVHLHGYWIEKPVVAGKATIVVTAKTPGRFEIELHEPDAVLGTLQVEP